jgi:hypothetical protein
MLAQILDVLIACEAFGWSIHLLRFNNLETAWKLTLKVMDCTVFPMPCY